MQKHYRNIILVIGCVLLGFFLLYRFAVTFAPGSYPYAEAYELNASEDNVINTIKQFKTVHPELSVPKVQIQNQGQFDLTDGRKDSSDLWYHIYFYYPQEHQIVYTWTRPDGQDKTIFAFVSLNSGLNLGNWKDINKDFSSLENKKLKEQFKERILDSIKQRLKHLY